MSARRCSNSRRPALGLLARDRDDADAEVMQIVLDSGFAVFAIGGHRARRLAGAPGDAFDRGRQLRGVGRVPDLDVVVEDDAVVVVHDLGFVAELDRDTERAFADRAGRRDRAS